MPAEAKRMAPAVYRLVSSGFYVIRCFNGLGPRARFQGGDGRAQGSMPTANRTDSRLLHGRSALRSRICPACQTLRRACQTLDESPVVLHREVHEPSHGTELVSSTRIDDLPTYGRVIQHVGVHIEGVVHGGRDR